LRLTIQHFVKVYVPLRFRRLTIHHNDNSDNSATISAQTREPQQYREQMELPRNAAVA